ncbi:MAG: hypothetical protein COV29_00455 [Candidatus Yanofskybacteria bacterium CG10_big_fil_rev_8_21_14_0_10_36_16]|uniref:ATPase AAA-3 domain-containing protein n=1 Tax=Candidatus Yanofskybacteria bacterium CG10_big_fil_rev_8_21_14_0_10_36_16 TaxID=1975096 RepID=A0A2J0Q8C8_9BACT|nr:MAG: hypothetical protein COV29_00455 [Candidatus Yanofskybacteria bacterium CG10_big_fil_rev_8_21_14_0_10_36_16]
MNTHILSKRNLSFTDEEAEDFRQKVLKIKEEVHKEIIGLDESIEGLIVALLAGYSGRGHVIFEAAPGRGKTLLINVLARVMDLKFKRLQGTPDWEPSDLLYSQKVEGKTIHGIVFSEGPIFTNILLADELNRNTQKFQAGLLDALEEKMVTFENEPRNLGPIFHVFATQNPIETAGTYGVSEALMDRFMFKIFVGFPTTEELRQIIARDQVPKKLNVLLAPAELTKWSKLIYENYTLNLKPNSTPVRYIADITERAYYHPAKKEGEGGESPSVRAGEDLKIAAGVEAFLGGRDKVSQQDVKKWIIPAFRGRYAISKRLAIEFGYGGEKGEKSHLNHLTDSVLADIINNTPFVPKEV